MTDSSFSRNPNDYRPEPGGHFRRRFRHRDIPPTAIRMCIESGDAQHQSDGRVALTNQYLRQTYTVVIQPADGFIITVFRGEPGESNEN